MTVEQRRKKLLIALKDANRDREIALARMDACVLMLRAAQAVKGSKDYYTPLATWREIGEALGITRQSAQQTYGQ